MPEIEIEIEIEIEGDTDGVIAGLVSALDDLPEAMPRYVLVGGLAVIVRVAASHRVTRDVDAVTWSADGTTDAAIEVLVDAGAKRTANGAVFEGVSIDVIATGDFEPGDVGALDQYDRAFITSHRWAFDSAEPARIVVFTRDGVQASATALLARPPALVAMKLGAIPRRKLANPAKRTSDIYDVFRLLQVFNTRGELAAGLISAPHELGGWCQSQLQDLLVDQAERSARWLATEGSPAMQAVSADDLRAVGEVAVADMRKSLSDALAALREMDD